MSQDDFCAGLPSSTEVVEKIKMKFLEIVKSVADFATENFEAIGGLSITEFGQAVGISALLLGIDLAFVVCSLCIPGFIFKSFKLGKYNLIRHDKSLIKIC